MNRTAVVVGLSVAACCALVSTLAGPLNPPAGPITSTAKPLTDVEPRIAINASNTPGDSTCTFRISQPGSYYLTGNVQSALNRHSILITASNVSIDMRGYQLVPFISPNLSAIASSGSSLSNISISNGGVTGWAQTAIDLSGAFNCRLSDLTLTNNTGDGLSVGSSSILTRCNAIGNTGSGIVCGALCTLNQCSASLNHVSGIVLGASCTCSGCVCSSNLTDGFSCGDSCALDQCSARQNAVNGFEGGGVFSNCSSAANGNGFHTGLGATVTSCFAGNNGAYGIVCDSFCIILNNTCSDNGVTGGSGGGGVHVTGIRNRIEGNFCGQNPTGFLVDGPHNLIIRNSCASAAAGGWIIADNNLYGPIIDRRNSAGGAVNGYSAASGLGSTDPNANFSN